MIQSDGKLREQINGVAMGSLAYVAGGYFIAAFFKHARVNARNSLAADLHRSLSYFEYFQNTKILDIF